MNVIDPTGRTMLDYSVTLVKVTATGVALGALSEALAGVYECISDLVESVEDANGGTTTASAPHPGVCYFPSHEPHEHHEPEPTE